MDRGNGNIFDFEDSIFFIFCINKIDSSNKKFIVKIIVGCENVLVDIGSVCIIIGEFVFRIFGRMLLWSIRIKNLISIFNIKLNW